MKWYVDLDGVLVDFTKQLCKLLDKPLDRDFEFGNDSKIWAKINKAGEQFWAEMDWMPDGHKLWDTLKKYDPTVLTAPTNHESSVEGKKKWLKKNLPGVPFIIEQDKTKYAEPESVLIDDREKNIKKWEGGGGVGLLHKDAVSTIGKMNEIISRQRGTKKTSLALIIKKMALDIRL